MAIRRRELPTGAIRYDARVRDASGKEVSKTFTHRRDAVEWEHEQQARAKKGKTVINPSKGEKFSKLWELWFSIQKPELSEGSITRMEWSYDNCQPLHELPVPLITREALAEWYQQLLTNRPWVSPDDNGLTPKTAWSVVMDVKRCLTFAEEEGYITTLPRFPRKNREALNTPITRDKIPPSHEISKMVKFFDEGGFDQGGAWCRPKPIYGDLVMFLTFTGCRAGEAAAITVEDVDTSKRSININKQSIGYGKNRHFAPLKTGSSSARVVYYPPSADQLMKQLITRAQALAVPGAARVLFRSTAKTPLCGQTLSRIITDASNALGFSWSAHNLRHRYASLLLTGDNPVSIVEVSHLMGHSSVATTATVYAHILRDDAPLISTKLNNDFLEVFGDPEHGEMIDPSGYVYDNGVMYPVEH